MRFVTSLMYVVVVIGSTRLPVAAQEDLQPLLEREIIGSALPLAEVQRFCESRVPQMPKIETAEQWQAEAGRLREAVLKQIVYRGKAAGWRDAKTKVEWLQTIDGGPGYHIKKLRYEALPGMWIPALLYEPDKLDGKVPAILNVNGHTGLGKQYPPKQIRCINQAKRGMLALNVEWVGMGQLRGDGYTHYRMNQLDLCGTSGLAPFYLCMKRGLDVLLGLENADPERIAVTGLSGGGWQTIVISSLDTRVKLANPVAGYSSFRTRARHFKDLGDSEQTPNDLATVVDYTHLTAMMAPRPTLLTFNSKDNCCFESGYALKPLVDAAQPMFDLSNKSDALRCHVNEDPGTHNYEVDNRQAFYRMLGDFFCAGDKDFDWREIPSDDEVKSQDELDVELPENNEDFHTLALGLSQRLPRQLALPKTKEDAVKWQRTKRNHLREIVRAKQYRVAAIESGREEKGATTATSGVGVQASACPSQPNGCTPADTPSQLRYTATFWRLLIGKDWTVPAVELVHGDPEKTAIVVADGGRKSVAGDVARLLESGHRVIAFDPFYFGECKITQRDFLFGLLVAAVGERPLGIQASQVAAVARWAAGRHKDNPVTVFAVGPRSSTFALVAAALEQKAIARVELYGALGSLKEVIEQNWGVNQKPELFCFGLLEAFDIKQITALVAPRPIRFVDGSDRVRSELAELSEWYRTIGCEFDPLD